MSLYNIPPKGGIKLEKDKETALKLLKQKNNGEIKITYKDIIRQSGYTKRQLIRLSKELEKRDIDSILVHGNSGKVPSNKAQNSELNYIIEYKKKYLDCSISQFMDIFHEDVVWNPKMKDIVEINNLQIRSYSFFQKLYHDNGWIIPRPHKSFNKKSIIHPLRNPSPRRGILIIIDGTPHDWFGNGKKQSLHLAIDDSTGEYLAGWFMEQECLRGYCHIFYLILTKYGIPVKFYSDNHSIFRSPTDKNLTNFGKICNELKIEMIYAGSAEAKGKVEKANDTIQQRIINDIKRFNITSVEQLNEWFNDFYCNYLNNKFAYAPKEEISEFIPLTKEFKNNNLNDLFSIKESRKILNGNCITYKNNYYVPVDKDNNVIPIYKGSTVEVWNNIFTNEIKICKNNILYKTKQIEGHHKSNELRLLKIHNQKELEVALDAVYSSSEERRKTVQAIVDKNALEEKKIKDKIAGRNILRNAGKGIHNKNVTL